MVMGCLIEYKLTHVYSHNAPLEELLIVPVCEAIYMYHQLL